MQQLGRYVLTCQHIINPAYKSNPKEELEEADDGVVGSPGGAPTYVVVDVHARVVVDAHGGCKVFVVGKSGLFCLVFTDWKPLFRLCASF